MHLDVAFAAPKLARMAGPVTNLPATTQPVPVVFIVDDDISVRESLEGLIEEAGWLPLAFASAGAFLAHPPVARPTCLILDVNLPDISGLDLQGRISDRTDMPIIFISGFGDVPMTVQAMRAGAVEFLTKPFDEAALLAAIEQALHQSRAALDREAELQALRDRHETLTCREREVLGLVTRGLLNKQVAFELGISEITVKAHRGQVMRKMKARTIVELVHMHGQLGLSTAAR